MLLLIHSERYYYDLFHSRSLPLVTNRTSGIRTTLSFHSQIDADRASDEFEDEIHVWGDSTVFQCNFGTTPHPCTHNSSTGWPPPLISYLEGVDILFPSSSASTDS